MYISESYIVTENFSDIFKSKMNSFPKIFKSFQQKLDLAYLKLNTDSNINVNAIKNIAKQSANKYKNSVVSGTKHHNKDLVNESISNSIKEARKKTRDLFDLKKSKVNKALWLCVTLLIYTTILAFFTSLLIGLIIGGLGLPVSIGANIALIFNAVIIAPIIEEIYKKKAIKKDLGPEFLILFNIIEFSSYLVLLSPMIGLPYAILMRIPAIIMHYITAYIHKYGRDKALVNNSQNSENFSFIFAVLLHSAFNIVGITLGTV